MSPSHRVCRRWNRIGLRGRMRVIVQNETGLRKRPARRSERKGRAEIRREFLMID